MSAAPVLPAPLWRRLAAGVYDSLLLIALWMVTVLFFVIGRDALGAHPSSHALTPILFLVGLAFHGWFWVHGGQTLGMRAWRLQVRRDDGSALRWPVAAVRYAAAWLSWLLGALGMLWCLIDDRRRAWHDILSSTEVVVLPKAP